MSKLMKFTFVFSLLFVMGNTLLFAQGLTVQGQVVDAIGVPVIGASVLEIGTSNGVITDYDGNFILDVESDESDLQISFIGYKTVVVPVSENMRVLLEEDTQLLDDVVVIGYGTVKKNDMTGSVTAIKPDDMNKGLQTNAQDMIAGKIAGVSVVSNNGAPGGGATIRIRGGASLNASNDPLIVIDGFAIDNDNIKGLSNPLSMVNPNDIESFTVLKDASATAIYGSRASNGVIIITTKKGQLGTKRPFVSYNGNVSVSANTKYLDVMDGNEYRDYVNKLYPDQPEIISKLGTANTDWQKEIYRTGVSQDHNITVSGGYKNLPYRVSIGYTGQNGVLKTSSFDRLTGSLNLNPTFFDKHLKINANAKAMYAKNRYADGGAVGAAVAFDPTQSIMGGSKYFNGYYQWSVDGASLNDEDPDMQTINSLAPKNPVALLDQKDDRAESQIYIGNIDIAYNIHGFEQLSAHVTAGGDYSKGEQKTIISPFSGTNHYYGYYGFSTEKKYNLSLSTYLQYTEDFNDKHFVNVMGGYEWQHFYREGVNKSHETVPETNTIDPGEKKNVNNVRWATENYLVSFYGRANYTALDRYLVTLTIRDDGTSRFSKANRWSLFPSVALGWKIEEEAFLDNADYINDLKLRLGWGITGQQNIGSNYAYLPTYVVNQLGGYYEFDEDRITVERPDAYNSDLKWEETTTWNAGVDFGIYNNKFTASLDFYYRETKDLLNTVAVAAGSNFKNKVLSNVGSMENKGVEFSANYRPISTNDLTWEMGFNATYNSNKITKLTTGTDPDYYVATGGISAGTGSNIQAQKVGYPANSFFVYQQVYDEAGNPIEDEFVDRNADGIINDKDKYIYKSPNADVLLGFNTKVIWKGWDLGFSLRASINNYVYNDVLSNAANVSSSGIWSTSGFFSNKPLSAVNLGWNAEGDYLYSDYFVQNASFLRMDNITLGYSFEKLFGVLSGRAYLTAQNVFTITKYEGLDPEVPNGIDNNIYPRPFIGVFGLSLTF